MIYREERLRLTGVREGITDEALLFEVNFEG